MHFIDSPINLIYVTIIDTKIISIIDFENQKNTCAVKRYSMSNDLWIFVKKKKTIAKLRCVRRI